MLGLDILAVSELLQKKCSASMSKLFHSFFSVEVSANCSENARRRCPSRFRASPAWRYPLIALKMLGVDVQAVSGLLQRGGIR